MGGGSWDTSRYVDSATTRKSTGVDDFAYTRTATKAHSNLDPARINSKPFGKLESRDSEEHPQSNPVLVCFDVTGSNYERAVEAQKRLPNLMELLNKYLTDPQVAVAANDDYTYVREKAVQISDFESDNRVDDHIRNIFLVGEGGGNDGESYDLLLYAAARKCVLDSVDKRGKRGYMFLYADEPIFKEVNASQVAAVFGDKLQANIPIAEIIDEARKLWNVFVVFPRGGYDHAREQYVKLFGEECVLDSQHPNLLCEVIATTIGLYEDKVTPDTAVHDLIAVGATDAEARAVTTALAVKTKGAGAALEATGAGSAARL